VGPKCLKLHHSIQWAELPKTTPTRGVSHYCLAIYIKKYLKAKEELWKLKYISPCKNIIFQKSSKRNQNPSKYYYNSIRTNLKFQHKPKISSFKNPLKETIILQDIIITLLELISSFNTSPKHHLSKIL
jgi:hypothetical protein